MVHPAAAEGFARGAAAYERARPGYPAPIVDFVARHVGRDVVELAAGTGKLTRLLVEAGLRVTAVEPVAEMRAALPPGARAVNGTAEEIPLPSACADGVVVAQAWHWFDAPRALREIHRVLRDRGSLVVVYNRRDMDDPVQRRIEELVAPHRGDAPSYRSHPFDGAPLFAPAGEMETRWSHTTDVAQRVASISFIAALPDAERERVLEQARALGQADLAYRCEAEAWSRLANGSA
jgi:SAM-dependent methyltransferase